MASRPGGDRQLRGGRRHRAPSGLTLRSPPIMAVGLIGGSALRLSLKALRNGSEYLSWQTECELGLI